MGLFSPRYSCRICGSRMREHPHEPVYYCPNCGHRRDERVNESILHVRNEYPYQPRERSLPYQQDDRVSPMYYNRAKKFSEHKWDAVDNYGYFGKKKRKR